jgi:hypothetical protein
MPFSQDPATGPYSEPDISSPHTFQLHLRETLILPSHLQLRLLSGLFPSGFPMETLY